jgi:glycerophosphoryl diester phosphodiesterase
MHFLCHRGYWTSPEEKNTLPAFARALEAGHGIETDVRDHAGELVISHDPAKPDAARLAEVLAMHARINPRAPLALNVKADGLSPLLVAALRAHAGAAACFCFDMSVPETLRYRRDGLRYFTRQSEFEPSPVLLTDAAGVWLDCFERDWIEDSHLAAQLSAGRTAALVSPELHGRDPATAWARLAASPWRHHERLLLCTDQPENARSTIFIP